jgi:hypothetical protein
MPLYDREIQAQANFTFDKYYQKEQLKIPYKIPTEIVQSDADDNKAKDPLAMTIADGLVDEGNKETEGENELFIIDRKKLVRTYISNFVKLYFDDAIARFP